MVKSEATPTEETLEKGLKEQLLKIADHYFTVADIYLKKKIKKIKHFKIRADQNKTNDEGLKKSVVGSSLMGVNLCKQTSV